MFVHKKIPEMQAYRIDRLSDPRPSSNGPCPAPQTLRLECFRAGETRADTRSSRHAPKVRAVIVALRSEHGPPMKMPAAANPSQKTGAAWLRFNGTSSIQRTFFPRGQRNPGLSTTKTHLIVTATVAVQRGIQARGDRAGRPGCGFVPS